MKKTLSSLLAALILWRVATLVTKVMESAPIIGTAHDFGSFIYSARLLASGAPMYGWSPWTTAIPANLNPPHWTALLLPLVPLSDEYAYLIWSALSALCLAASVWLAYRTTPATWAMLEVLTVSAIVVWSGPVATVLEQGQVTWFLMLMVALAVRADSRQRHRLFGGLIGALVTVKPFLLTLLFWPLVRRNSSSMWSAGFVAIGIVLVGLVALGVDAYLLWIEQVRSIKWFAHWSNVSVLGWWARSGAPWSIEASLFCSGLLATVTGVAVVTGARSRLRTNGLLLISAFLLSPLAWAHYLCLGLPLVIAGRPWREAPVVCAGISILLIVSAFPPSEPMSTLVLLTQASAATYGSLMVWAALVASHWRQRVAIVNDR